MSRQTGFGFNEDTLALFGVAVLVFGALLWAARGPLAEKADFSLVYMGARIVYSGHGADLYDVHYQQQVNASLFSHPQPLIFEHPPFEALIFAPLAALPYRTAYLIWGIVNACAWLAVAVMFRPYAPVPREPLGYFALWLLFAPLGVALFQGQTSLFLLLIYALTLMQMQTERHFRAGVWLGLGLFKFQFVLPFAAIFILRRHWKFLKGFACSAGLIALLSLTAVGFRGIVGYLHLLSQVGSGPENVSYGAGVDMPTLLGFVYAIVGRWLGAHSLLVVVAILSSALIAGTAWSPSWNAGAESARNLMLAASIAVSLICGVHMFTHDFAPLMLALLLTLAHFPSRENIGLRLALSIALLVFWTPPVYFLFVTWHCMYLMFPVLLMFVIAASLLARKCASPALMESETS